jgi:hypothetical protein
MARLARPAGAMVSNRPRVSALIRAHRPVSCSLNRTPMDGHRRSEVLQRAAQLVRAGRGGQSIRVEGHDGPGVAECYLDCPRWALACPRCPRSALAWPRCGRPSWPGSEPPSRRPTGPSWPRRCPELASLSARLAMVAAAELPAVGARLPEVPTVAARNIPSRCLRSSWPGSAPAWPRCPEVAGLGARLAVLAAVKLRACRAGRGRSWPRSELPARPPVRAGRGRCPELARLAELPRSKLAAVELPALITTRR